MKNSKSDHISSMYNEKEHQFLRSNDYNLGIVYNNTFPKHSASFSFETKKLIKHAMKTNKYSNEIIMNSEMNKQCKNKKQLKFQKVLKIFKFKGNIEISVENFIERLVKLTDLSTDILSVSCLIFYKVVWIHDITFCKKESYIKLFSGCLWLAYKQILDINISGKTFSKIVGFSIRALKKMEKALFLSIFKGNMLVTATELEEFKKDLKFSFKE